MTIREQIDEVIDKIVYDVIHDSCLLTEDYRNLFLNLKVKVKCDLCIQERKTMPSFATTVGCQCGDTGYITKILGEIVDEK
ncbi:hypothetical protein LCGC14_1081250 [marine sediment metagenome]|uniref:Uncharacterized protein n=1 Tax=marine sediment metagenome TaxID=412755 RepID=A0A0F9N2Q9_9ZZZZ